MMRRLSTDAAAEEHVKVVFDGYSTYRHFEFPDITPLKLRAMTTLESFDTRQARRLKLLHKFLISHRSKWRTSVIKLSFVASFYAANSTPAFVAFGYEMYPVFFILQMLVYAVFWLDIFCEFNSTYQAQNGHDISDHISIAEQYIRTWFVIDFLAALPFHVYQSSERLENNFKLEWDLTNRMDKHPLEFRSALQLVIVFAKFLREAIRMRKVGFSSTRYATIVHGLSYAAYLLTLIQILTAILFVVCQTENSVFFAKAMIGELDTMVAEQGTDVSNAYLMRYIVFLHYATVYILGKGEPTCTAERIFAISTNVLGLFFTATVVGQVTHIIHQANAKVSKWRAKMEEVDDSMLQMGLSPDLQNRIRNYYAFSWAVNGGEDKNFRWLQDLSKGYHEAAAIQMNENLIASVPIFRVADRAFVHAIIMKLQQQLYLPGDYIIKHGDIGNEMYFVVKGTVQAMDKEETVIYTTLSEGSFFGEIALLKKNSRRTATVRSFTYAQLNVLYKADFEEILVNFPKDAALLEAEARQREQKSDAMAKIKEKRMQSQSSQSRSHGDSLLYTVIPESEGEAEDDDSDSARGHAKNSSFRKIHPKQEKGTKSSADTAHHAQENSSVPATPTPSGGIVFGTSSILATGDSPQRLSFGGAVHSARFSKKSGRSYQVSPDMSAGDGQGHNTIFNLDADGEIDLCYSQLKKASTSELRSDEILQMLSILTQHLQASESLPKIKTRRISMLVNELNHGLEQCESAQTASTLDTDDTETQLDLAEASEEVQSTRKEVPPLDLSLTSTETVSTSSKHLQTAETGGAVETSTQEAAATDQRSSRKTNDSVVNTLDSKPSE